MAVPAHARRHGDVRCPGEDPDVGHAAVYDDLADEYYEAGHITSRNFDATTTVATADWRDRLPEGLLLEAGAGRGRAGEFLGATPERVVQLDSSAKMLALPGRERALVHVLHDAEELPFPDAEFGCVAAFLCDGFLGLNFLSEARRVLKPGGVLFGTTPGYEWGSALRELLEIDVMETRFVLKGGDEVRVASFLYPRAQLEEMLSRAGFTAEVELREHSLPRGTVEISSDISRPAERLHVEVNDLPILYSFRAVA
jgi:SAM-dependent methyltransferase